MKSGKLFPSLAIAALAAALGCSSNSNFSSDSGLQAPVATLSTTTLSFGTVPLGQTSSAQSITITNTGGGSALSLATPGVHGTNPSAFLTTSNCPAVLIKNASCTVSVAFSPTANGALSAYVAFADSAANSPQDVTVSGTGSSTGPVVSLSSSSLTFTSLPVGQAATQSVTLSNIGSASLNLSGFTVTGTNATSFAVSGPCVTTAVIPAGGNCSLTVTYAPTVTGAVAAQININDNATGAPQTITLASH